MNTDITLEGSPKPVVATAYFHLAVRMSEADKKRLAAFLEEHTSKYAAGLSFDEPQFSVRLVEGTLKGWVKFAAAIYFTISSYGSFRSGVDYLIQDARIFSERVFSELRTSGIPEDAVLRAEHRIGILGRIKRMCTRVDRLKRRARHLGSGKIQNELDRIHEDLSEILPYISDEQAKLLVENIEGTLNSEVPNLLPFPMLPLKDQPRRRRMSEISQLTSRTNPTKTVWRRQRAEPLFRVEVKGDDLKLVPTDE